MNEKLAKWDPIIEAKSRQYGLPASLVRSVIWQESRGNPGAKSPVGAVGLMQLMPGTAKELGVNPYDPEQNIDGGVRYLKKMVSQFGLVGGVAAYNAGPGNVQKYKGVPPFKETQGYVKNVLGNFGGDAGAMSGGASADIGFNRSSPYEQMSASLRVPINNLRRSLGMDPIEPTTFKNEDSKPKFRITPFGNIETEGLLPPYLKPLEDTANFLSGTSQTVLKGANQGAAKILDTGARALRDLTPFGLHNTVQGLAQSMGMPSPEPDSIEGKLYEFTRKANPFNYVANLTGQLKNQALGQPETTFEKKYSEPIYQTKGGTPIIPSLGEFARSTGEYLPEMALTSSLPAQSFGQQIASRFSPAIQPAIQRAAQSSFGGLMGGTMKGQPGEAALNTVLFPAMSLAGEGVGYYGKQALQGIKKELPAIKNMLSDETGALRLRKQPIPLPESPETIALQMDALKAGRSQAVLVTPGAAMPEVPKGFQIVKTDIGTWVIDPKKVKPYQIKRDVLRGDYGKYLGHVEPKGPNTSQVVTATQGGVEAKSSVVSPENTQAQVIALRQQFPQAEIRTGGPEVTAEVLQKRLQSAPPITGKERGFVTTVKESPMSPEPVAKGVSGTYTPITNQGTLSSAQEMVRADPVKARDILFSTKEPTADTYAIGMELMRVNNAKGDFSESIRIADHIAKQATKQGQAIQALSIYDKLGPEGVLKLASKTVQAARDELPKAKIIRLERETQKVIEGLKASGQKEVNVEMVREVIAEKLKLPNLSEEFAQNITKRAASIQAMPEGYEKSVATAEMLRDIGELVPSSTLRKISSFQTIAQLYNPKTMIRNVVGNAMFTGGENVKDIVAAPLDRAVSLVTGQRTKTLAGWNQIPEQAKGFVQGLKQGASEAWKGIDTSRVADKFEINQIKQGFTQGRTFRGKIMGNIERSLGVALRAPDRAFYQAAFNKSMAEQMSLAGAANPTDDMIARAHFEGLYKTFQDDSAAAKLFSGLKRTMNFGKEFGAGDILLKYPKTPGNILSRSLEYSPAGFVKGLFELGRAAMGHGFDQKAFVDTTSRAIVGTGGLTALGYGLSKIGILRNSAPRDPDIRAVEAAEGRNQSQLNVSALNRWLMSGFDKKAAQWKPEDQLVSYDWAVPLSTSLTLGARAQEKGLEESVKLGNQLDNLGLFSAGIEGALETLGDQPMIKTFTSLARGQTLPKSLIQAAKGIPASFTPTMLKQFYQLTDNTRRDTFDPNPVIQALNLAIGKTPFAGKLPAKIDVFGKPMENYQGGTNSILNVMLNPSFMSKYRPTPESKMVLDLYKNTSDARVVPIVVGPKFTFNGIQMEMSGRQTNNMQKWVGERTQKFFAQMAGNKEFMAAPDEAKVKVLTEYLLKLRSAARGGVFVNEINQKSLPQRIPYVMQLAQKYKLSEDQIKGIFRDMALFQVFNGAGQ